MSPQVSRLAVLGLGLLGGSVAMAARSRGVAGTIVGAGRSAASQEGARAAGVFDAVGTPEDAVAGADLVVLATPVSAMAPLLRGLAPRLEQGALVTDVGSVKGPVADTLPGLLPPGTHFVGAHPMAGGHRSGIAHARPDLLQDACVVVTPTSGADPEATRRVEGFWRALGARVLRRTPEQHDAAVAWTSHLPHLVAFAFGAALGHAPPGSQALAGPGFRDFTRIARSDAGLWAEILGWNAKAVAGPLQQFASELQGLGRALEDGRSDELVSRLARATDVLASEDAGAETDFDARSGGGNPEIRVSDGGAARSRPKTS